MRREPWAAVTTVILVIAAVTGLVDAAAARTWDLVVVFAVIAALGLVVLGSGWRRRPSVGIRRDLVAWMAVRAAEGGERVEDVADRAVAAYRAGLTPDPDPGRRR